MSGLAAAQAAYARGDFAAALGLAEPLLASPGAAAARALCANAAMQLARWHDAIAHLRALQAATPTPALARALAQCWLKQGNAQRRAERPAAAEQCYREALQTLPGFADAQYNLALLLLESARPAEALTHLDALDTMPDVEAARLRALTALGRWDEARRRHAAAIPPADDADAQAAHALNAAALALPVAWTPALRRRIAEPAHWREALSLAAQLRSHGALEPARELLDLALPAQRDAGARLALTLSRALGLPAVCESAATLAAVRRDYAEGLARLEAEWPAADIARAAPPPQAFAWDNFYLAYHGEDDRALQQRYGRWLAVGLETVLPSPARPRRPPRPRPRVALISRYLHRCTVGMYFLSWAQQLAASGFELVAVLLGAAPDEISDAYARCGRLLRVEADVTKAAAQIGALEADLILYPELGMDATTFALAALRLAPRQVCAWGHPISSGLPTIDAFVSCAEMEPEGASSHYSESLYLLPGLGTVYPAPPVPPPRPRAAFGLPEAATLYLLPQSPFKLHPDMDAVVADVLARDPQGLLVGVLGPAAGASLRVAQRFAGALGERGLDPARLRWLPACARADYLALNAVCDVMLDSLRWSGGNASIDALCAGLPVVTCPGALMRGRQSQAMLRRLDRADWIAPTPAALAERAVAVAQARRAGHAAAQVPADALAGLLGDPAPLAVLSEHLHALLAARND